MSFKDEWVQRAIDINRLADSAKTEGERMEVIRAGLSSNRVGSPVTTPKDLGAFIAACWDQGVSPLLAFRLRLGGSWVVVAHCYATRGAVTPDFYLGELFLEIPVNGIGVQFRRIMPKGALA
jgi:hypothetical protein